MATKKTAEKEEKKVSTTKAKSTEKKTPAKSTKAKEVAKSTEKKEEKLSKVSTTVNLEELESKIEKLEAELSIIKQFKNSSDKNASDKIFAELENLREAILGLEDRLEELEYQISEKDDY